MRIVKPLIASSLLGVMLTVGAGCQGRSSIPPAAHLEQSSAGGLNYTAHEAGNVYVLDSDKNEKVFEGHMKNGDQIVVNPNQDKIILGGNEAEHSVTLKPGHRYQIYFQPNP